MEGWLDGRRGLLAVLAAALFVELFMGLFFRFDLIDDAYISLRYAKNFVEGGGLAYNGGELVEGYSNFLWVMLLSSAFKLGFSMRFFALFFGLLSGVLSVLLLHAVCRDLGYGRDSCLTACLFVVINPVVMYWFVSGMETGLYTFLVLSAVFLYFRGLRQGFFHPILPVALFLASLARADGILLAIATIAHYAFFRRANRVKAGLSWAWAVFLPYGAYILAKSAYYHSLLPNTFYAKVNLGGGFFVRGLIYFAFFVLTNLASMLYFVRARLGGIKMSWPNLYIIALLSCFAGAYVFIGGDHMPVRLMVPFYFLFSLLVAPVFGGWIAEFASKQKLLFACILLMNLLINLTYNGSWLLIKRDVEAERKCVGLWLGEHLGKNATIAVVEAGIIPYYSGLRTIDMCGLNDYELARMNGVPDAFKAVPGHDRCNLGYGLSKSPDFVSYFGNNITQYDVRYGPVEIECDGREVVLYLKNATKYT
ncbi:MAG: hypothetical protein PHG85_03040 [Candidatus Altiarchaeota archaeon]|nr:hypothetical protein [Candidatus Altiarchaeota archaeon]